MRSLQDTTGSSRLRPSIDAGTADEGVDLWPIDNDVGVDYLCEQRVRPAPLPHRANPGREVFWTPHRNLNPPPSWGIHGLFY